MRLPPLTWVALSFLSGLVIADITAAPLSTGCVGLGGTLLLWFYLTFTSKKHPISPLIKKSTRLGLIPMVLGMVFFSGTIRYQLSHPPVDFHDLSWYNGSEQVSLVARIISDPEAGGRTQTFFVSVESICLGSWSSTPLQVSGKALVVTGLAEKWTYGSRILLTGKMTSPSEEAGSYREYLARKSTYSSLYYPEIQILSSAKGNPVLKWIYNLRRSSSVVIETLFPSPESPLLSGILLGLDNQIPQDLQEAFRQTGTTHIIAISGFNISILTMLLSSIFSRLLGMRRGALITGSSLVVYTILAGASPSVVRAAIMGSLGIFAALIGRKQIGVNSLSFTALIMCLIDPNLPWDVSFQLSFLSTLGLILFADPLSQMARGLLSHIARGRTLDVLVCSIGEYFLFTFAALVMTLPVMAYHFQTLSWVSLIANPLILPAQPAVMVTGGVATILGLIWLPLGKIAAVLACPYLSYTIQVVRLIGDPAAANRVSIHPSPGFILLYYLGIILLIQRGFLPFLKKIFQPGLVLICSLAITFTLWQDVAHLPDGQLHIDLFDGGKQESLLIQSPGGRYILVGTGADSATFAQTLGQYLPRGFRVLDLVFLNPNDKASTIAFKNSITGVTISELIWVGCPSGENEISDTITIGNTATSSAGYRANLGSSIDLVVSPYPSGGALFILHWNDFMMVFPFGDIPNDWLERAAPNLPRSPTAILLAGNGEAKENSLRELLRLQPSLILVNSQPEKADPLPWYAGQPWTVLHTLDDGGIHLSTDGFRIRVEREGDPE